MTSTEAEIRRSTPEATWSRAPRWPLVTLALSIVAVACGCADGAGSDATRAVQSATSAPRVVVPVIDASMKARLRTIYAAGLALGNRGGVFAKIGDSITTSTSYLTGIGCGTATLGTHTELAPIISYFRATTLTGATAASCSTTINSFTRTSVAAGSAWTTASALARVTRSDCPAPYNTALKCELHIARPSVALIMLGTYDLDKINNVTTFTTNLTQIVTDTIAAGVIPVLSTIPPRLDKATLTSRVAAYNSAVIAVAAAQQVPLWDYWVAMTGATMVNQGIATAGVLPNAYSASPVNFTTAALNYGFNERNMTALQVLAHVKAIVHDNGTPDPDPLADAGADVTDVTDVTDVIDVTDVADVTDVTDVIDVTDVTVDATVDAGSPGRMVVPYINAAMKTRLRTIYTAGLALGNRAAMFSKVGDGITASTSFLLDIGCSAETLGAHTELAPTISYFRATSLPGRTSAWCNVSNAFSATSVAADSGWTTVSVLAGVTRVDCPSPYNTMLKCELHLTRPSMALIMAGSNDLELFNDLAGYTTNLTRIVTDTIAAGVIPVLSTLPPRTDNATLGARVSAYNDAVLAVAAAQQVPVWDYWLAMTAPSMLNQGLDSDGLHPSVYLNSDSCNFSSAALAYGYNQRNMTAVQVLAHVKAVVLDDGAPDVGGAVDAGTDAGLDASADVLDASADVLDASADALDASADIAVDRADAADASADVTVDATVDGSCVSSALVPAATEAALQAQRQACAFTAGARVADTLGVTAAVRARIPVDHVVIVMQENHSFDQYLGALPGDVDRIPAGYTNPNLAGAPVSPSVLTAICTADPPHQWDAVHQGWNLGAMNGFARVGEEAGIPASVMLGYYTASQIPFYHWLYQRFAMSDRYFASVLSGTWATRDFAYMASSYGVRNTLERVVSDKPTIFDRLDAAGTTWGVYTNGGVRQDCIGWNNSHRNVYSADRFFTELAAGTLPSVVFLDAIDDATDEHPPTNVHLGETFVRSVVSGVVASPLWSRLALIVTYDEAGGFFDHVAPPSACLPHPSATAGYDTTDLNRLGIRVPFVVVSPWARARFVSHVVHDHTSILRFVETLFDLPALTARDANAAALLDLFDFSCASTPTFSETIPAVGTTTTGCP